MSRRVSCNPPVGAARLSLSAKGPAPWLTHLPRLPFCWVRVCAFQQVSGWTPSVKTALAWLTACVSHCHGSQGTQPLAPLLHSLLLFCIPASRHLQVPFALMFSKSFPLPLFMFLLLSYLLVAGNPCMNPPPKHVFPASTVPSSLCIYLLHICIPSSFQACSQHAANKRYREIPFPRPPNLAEGNRCPECSTSALTDSHVPGCPANQSSLAAPELGTKRAWGWWQGFARPCVVLPPADISVPQQDPPM